MSKPINFTHQEAVYLLQLSLPTVLGAEILGIEIESGTKKLMTKLHSIAVDIVDAETYAKEVSNAAFAVGALADPENMIWVQDVVQRLNDLTGGTDEPD